MQAGLRKNTDGKRSSGEIYLSQFKNIYLPVSCDGYKFCDPTSALYAASTRPVLKVAFYDNQTTRLRALSVFGSSFTDLLQLSFSSGESLSSKDEP
jgi:hypothetical protein